MVLILGSPRVYTYKDYYYFYRVHRTLRTQRPPVVIVGALRSGCSQNLRPLFPLLFPWGTEEGLFLHHSLQCLLNRKYR